MLGDFPAFPNDTKNEAWSSCFGEEKKKKNRKWFCFTAILWPFMLLHFLPFLVGVTQKSYLATDVSCLQLML